MKRTSLPPLVAALLITVAFAQTPRDRGRVSIAPEGTFQFKELKIAVLAIRGVDSTVGTPRYVASIRVQEGGATEQKSIQPPQSFNWHGYHVAIPAVHGPDEPGGERVEFAVTMVALLPQCIGKPIGKDSPWPCTVND